MRLKQKIVDLRKQAEEKEAGQNKLIHSLQQEVEALKTEQQNRNEAENNENNENNEKPAVQKQVEAVEEDAQVEDEDNQEKGQKLNKRV